MYFLKNNKKGYYTLEYDHFFQDLECPLSCKFVCQCMQSRVCGYVCVWLAGQL